VKLLSSIQWLRRNPDYTIEENALAHLLGLRISLWPWRTDFLEVEELIDQYVDKIEVTPSIRNILKARIPEKQIIDLHLRMESSLAATAAVFLQTNNDLCGVRDLIISAIFHVGDVMSHQGSKDSAQSKKHAKKNKAKGDGGVGTDTGVSRSESKRRAEQSRRDKAQQTTHSKPVQPFATAGYSPEVLRVIGALIDPDNYPPFRLPDGGRPTALAQLRDARALQSNATDTTELVAAAGFAVARRDPRCALIVTEGGHGVSMYDVICPNGTTAPLRSITSNNPWPVGCLQYVAGTDKRHGQYVAPWVFNDGIPRFWLQSPVGKEASIRITLLNASTAYTMNVNWLCGKQQVIDGITATSDASGTIIFNFSSIGTARQGYVYFSLTSGSGAGCTVRITDQSTTAVTHNAAPGFWDTIADIDSIRVNSFSLMCSDRSADLTTQGDIVGYQSSGGVGWDEVLGLAPGHPGGLDPYTAITAQTKLCFKGAYKRGRYYPVKSSADPREADLLDIGDSTAPWDIPPINFQEQMNFLIIAYNTKQTSAAIIGEWTMAMHCEYETESQWRNAQKAIMHPDVLKEAKHAIAGVDFDFENPSHLAKVWNIVKRAAKHILPYANAATVALPPQFQVPARLGLSAAELLMD
jgi:hypothetical protein